MTRRFAYRALSGGALALLMTAPVWAGVFGRVVPIGGQASDIALDEPRGFLYIANFAANRIEVTNTSDFTISRSINLGRSVPVVARISPRSTVRSLSSSSRLSAMA